MFVTPLYIALLALFFVALSFNVARARMRTQVALGHEGAHDLFRRVRAQGNFAEYTPIFLLLLAAAEFYSMNQAALHGFGIVFMISRLMHAYSLLKAEAYRDGKLTAKPVWRMWGMICTLGCISVLALYLLVSML